MNKEEKEHQPGQGPKPPSEMSTEELIYRKELQEAILHVTQLMMSERKEEILERAKLRLTLLRGERK